MKNISILLVALLVVSTAAPLAAQDTLHNKVQRTVAAQKPDPKPQKPQPDSKLRSSRPCDGMSQPCSTKDSAGVCPEHKKADEMAAQTAQQNYCPHCGQEYTVDEKYHGVKHICKEHKKVCAYCGEEMIEYPQHCFATDGIGICSEQRKTSDNTPQTVPDNFCPVCGHQYTVDEKYHGVKHVCKENKKEHKKVCAYCGEEILDPYHQICPAQEGSRVCSTQKQNTDNTPKTTQQDYCPHCGQAYTVDEKYHGDKHTCNK